MDDGNLYEEKIFLRVTTITLVSFTVVMLLLLIYLISAESYPILIGTFLGAFILFVVVTLNFNTLAIRITPEFVRVAYGIFRRKSVFENIEDCYLDNVSNFGYWGFGIRIARVSGRWRIVYNIFKCPRVVLSLKKGRIREVVFSTKNPEEVMRRIKNFQTGG